MSTFDHHWNPEGKNFKEVEPYAGVGPAEHHDIERMVFASKHHRGDFPHWMTCGRVLSARGYQVVMPGDWLTRDAAGHLQVQSPEQYLALQKLRELLHVEDKKFAHVLGNINLARMVLMGYETYKLHCCPGCEKGDSTTLMPYVYSETMQYRGEDALVEGLQGVRCKFCNETWILPHQSEHNTRQFNKMRAILNTPGAG